MSPGQALYLLGLSDYRIPIPFTSAVIPEMGPNVSFLFELPSSDSGMWGNRAAESEIKTGKSCREMAFGEWPVSGSAFGSHPPHFRDDQWLCGSERINSFFLEPE